MYERYGKRLLDLILSLAARSWSCNSNGADRAVD